MPLMRDKGSGVVREVHPRYLARFPGEYVEVTEPIEVPKIRPSKKSAASPTGAIESREGEE